MSQKGPGDQRPPKEPRTVEGGTPDNPLAIPTQLQQIRADIDWPRRVVRFEQRATPFDINPSVVVVPFHAAKRISALIIAAEAEREATVASQPPTREPNGDPEGRHTM